MIENIENEVGRRPITEQELRDQRKNSPFMVMAYVLARQAKAQDRFNGIVIGNDLAHQEYYLHHIFPKSLLKKYDLRKDSRIVDQVANLVFLTSPLSKSAANRPPATYLPEIDEKRLRSQSISLQPDLWEIEQFEHFMRQRRMMLANAINQLLLSLTEEKQLWISTPASMLEMRIDALERQLRKVIEHRFQEKQGDNAWDHLVPPEIRNSVKNLIKKQEENKPFTAGQHESLAAKLEFCLYSELFKIVKNNWALFKDIFGNEQQLDSYRQFVITARNGFKHGHMPSDVDLASAEAGLLWFEKCLDYVTIEDEEEIDILTATV